MPAAEIPSPLGSAPDTDSASASGLVSRDRGTDLEYLNRAADAVQQALNRGATDEAGPVLDRLLEAVDVELVARGNVAGDPALFEDLLLAAQVERELQLVKERARASE